MKARICLITQCLLYCEPRKQTWEEGETHAEYIIRSNTKYISIAVSNTSRLSLVSMIIKMLHHVKGCGQIIPTVSCK